MDLLIRQAGGEIVPVDNGTSGCTRFGGLEHFRTACMSAAGEISRRAHAGAGPLLIVAFDAPFYGLGPLLAPAARSNLVVVARSTAALHAPHDAARINWERDGLRVTAASGGRIAAISAHMRAHLATSYGIPGPSLADLPNGLTASDWQHTRPPETSLLPPAGRRGFLLAMGRAVPYKGFEDLLDALVLLHAEGTPVPHTLLAAVTDDPRPSPYQEHLAGRIASDMLDVTLVTRFTPGLRSLLHHPALAAVVVPSRADPFGRIPLEAFAAGAAPVVATTAGGLAELVTDNQTGYTARPANPRSLAGAVRRALTASPADRARLRAEGRRLASVRYDYGAIVRSFLRNIAPWAGARPDQSA